MDANVRLDFRCVGKVRFKRNVSPRLMEVLTISNAFEYWLKGTGSFSKEMCHHG